MILNSVRYIVMAFSKSVPLWNALGYLSLVVSHTLIHILILCATQTGATTGGAVVATFILSNSGWQIRLRALVAILTNNLLFHCLWLLLLLLLLLQHLIPLRHVDPATLNQGLPQYHKCCDNILSCIHFSHSLALRLCHISSETEPLKSRRQHIASSLYGLRSFERSAM
jgi:hypothetical protein